jgi:U3 small nucleolar RNA-associated protein 21
MSASTDNSVKQWLMEEPGAAVRLLRYRCGHALPPTCVLHYDTDGRRILSAGQDLALRVFSTVQDQQSVELSQRHVEHRAKKQKVRAEPPSDGKVTSV